MNQSPIPSQQTTITWFCRLSLPSPHPPKLWFHTTGWTFTCLTLKKGLYYCITSTVLYIEKRVVLLHYINSTINVLRQVFKIPCAMATSHCKHKSLIPVESLFFLNLFFSSEFLRFYINLDILKFNIRPVTKCTLQDKYCTTFLSQRATDWLAHLWRPSSHKYTKACAKEAPKEQQSFFLQSYLLYLQ